MCCLLHSYSKRLAHRVDCGFRNKCSQSSVCVLARAARLGFKYSLNNCLKANWRETTSLQAILISRCVFIDYYGFWALTGLWRSLFYFSFQAYTFGCFYRMLQCFYTFGQWVVSKLYAVMSFIVFNWVFGGGIECFISGYGQGFRTLKINLLYMFSSRAPIYSVIFFIPRFEVVSQHLVYFEVVVRLDEDNYQWQLNSAV